MGDDTRESILGELGLNGIPSQEALLQEIEEQVLLPKDKVPEHWLSRYQIHWDHHISIPSLLSIAPSPPSTTVRFQRAGLDGRITGYAEARAPRVTATGLTSTSLTRAPAPSSSFVRGKTGYMPFLPGGLYEAIAADKEPNTDSKGLPGRGFRTIPPGFSRGLRLPGEEVEEDELVPPTDDNQASPTMGDHVAEPTYNDPSSLPIENGEESGIDSLLPADRSFLAPRPLRRSARNTAVTKRDWAHVVDVNKPLKNFHELVPDMAHKYPFELDTFQKEAVYHLEMGDSVFVAAHTSAGKTVVAEYAIALAAKHMTRAIYTSPIKALSNQKYRDFKMTFDPTTIGILTGDVQINPEGSCLIMTTEILRSMLYKGADLIRDVEFVIFDEVHYVNDLERGVVWEEVIIMLPDHISIILLSATVPNTKEFADWVGRTKKKDIYVISTMKRPVPLEHYLWAGNHMHKIVDAQGQFLGQGYQDAGNALRRKQDKEREAAGLAPVVRVGARGATPQRGGGPNQRGGAAGGRGRGGPPQRGGAGPPRGRGGGNPTAYGTSGPRMFQQHDKNLFVHLIGHLKKQQLLPVVVFTFSKKRCEEQAATLINLDLATAAEKSEVHITIERGLSRLKGTDKKLPQIARMADLLGRGIAVHHGGLLPIVKEVVEILFAKGLVKVLFATETFAMGVNMPTRCVVFSNTRKHDGRSFRDLLPGEYTQMSGRAGRRGLDATGVVIIVSPDELPDTSKLHNMLLGPATKLSSQFRLTYNMILNLLRVEALKVEEMIKRSFSENASQRLLPEQQKQVLEAEKVLHGLPKVDCDVCAPDIRLLYDVSAEILNTNEKIITLASTHPQGLKILTPGRVVVLNDGKYRNKLAVIIKPAPPSIVIQEGSDKRKAYFMLVSVDLATKAKAPETMLQAVPPLWPPKPESLLVHDVVYEMAPVLLSSVTLVTDKILKADIMEIERLKITPMQRTAVALQELAHEWVDVGEIEEVEWDKIRTLEFQDALRARDAYVKRSSGKACLLCEDFQAHYAVLHEEKQLLAKISQLKLALSDQNLELLPDFEQRIAVLKELRHIDENQTVLLKGRVACEINSTNELVLTELILENTLASYDPEEVVALLSAFVFQEKTDVEPVLSPKLEAGKDAILSLVDKVGRVQDAQRVSAPDFQTAIKFGLTEVVYEWAKGMPFEQITHLTDVAEGTIVRVITRLDETCREVRDAARVIGDMDLFKKMEDAQIKIKRDIVFAASLYF
ncbi:hypothetical protein FRB93_002652 [Tulasnella sp. JGI-2019a]|nr:hypothetical protein FRB93_002652 [Tulasnella sp. JGI-2019a]